MINGINFLIFSVIAIPMLVFFLGEVVDVITELWAKEFIDNFTSKIDL